MFVRRNPMTYTDSSALNRPYLMSSQIDQYRIYFKTKTLLKISIFVNRRNKMI